MGTKVFICCSNCSYIGASLTASAPARSATGSTRRWIFFGGVRQRQQFLRCGLALTDLCQFDNKVDDLVLEDRCPQTVDRTRGLTIKIEDLAFVAGTLARLAGNSLVHLLLGDGNIVSASDLRQHQA